jgi:hypothetical protein
MKQFKTFLNKENVFISRKYQLHSDFAPTLYQEHAKASRIHTTKMTKIDEERTQHSSSGLRHGGAPNLLAFDRHRV